MFNTNGFFVEYSGWFILFSAVAVVLFAILMIAGTDTKSNVAAWAGFIGMIVAIVMAGCSIIGYVKNLDHDRDVKFATRNCREVSAQKVESFVDGTPVVIDDIYGDVTVCER